MKTATVTQKERHVMIREYIIDCISTEGYDITAETPAEKIKFLVDTFKKEYWNAENMRYYKTFQNCFNNWCMGLPSSFNIEFENYKIIELGVKWGLLTADASEAKQQRFIKQYWNSLYMSAHNVAKHYKIEF